MSVQPGEWPRQHRCTGLQRSDYSRENKETFQPEQLTRLQERSEEDFFKSVYVVNDFMRVIMQEKGSNTKETGLKQKSS